MTIRFRLAVGVACLVLATVLGIVIVGTVGDGPLAVDSWWNDLMLRWRTPLLLSFAHALDRIGGGWVAIVLVPLAIIVGLLLARRRRSALFAVAAFLASALAVQILKNVFARGRPEDILVTSDFGSFPSGHTANAATIAVVLWVLFPRRWVAIAGAGWVLAMAYSRAALSAHWVSDTVGGALVGGGVALIAAAIATPWLMRERRAAEEAFRIRSFRPEDADGIAAVCMRTADAGKDATGLLRDDMLWADVFALPYARRHPDLGWVVEGPGGTVAGYVLGVPDTDAFERWFREEWWPSHRGRYEGADASPREAGILRYAATRAPGAVPVADEYPAHLHIDLLPEAQGRGLGRALTDTLFAELVRRGVLGLHVGVDPRNASAAAFYERLGFRRLPSEPDALLLGIRLDSPPVTGGAQAG